jgi:heme/copper-type cytochrome/quinol oxidase subunit 2
VFISIGIGNGRKHHLVIIIIIIVLQTQHIDLFVCVYRYLEHEKNRAFSSNYLDAIPRAIWWAGVTVTLLLLLLICSIL